MERNALRLMTLETNPSPAWDERFTPSSISARKIASVGMRCVRCLPDGPVAAPKARCYTSFSTRASDDLRLHRYFRDMRGTTTISQSTSKGRW